jgi:hypothetical protein
MNEITRVDGTNKQLAEVRPAQHTAMDILAAAVQSGQSAETLTQLVALSERMAATEAERAFTLAMAAFRAACPPVQRRTENAQFKVTRDGRQVNRMYASLDDIAATIRKPLGEHGFSYRWSDAIVEPGKLTLSCVVSHAGGHSKSSSITLPTESKAGCSEAQKVGAILTYAQRYSLINALGLTSCDEDNDGNDEAPAERISDADLLALEVALDEIKADLPKFKQYMGVERLADIPASKVRQAFDAIARRKAGGK